jgi:hypothetical protein
MIWAENSWFCFGDCRIFACGVTADGEQFTTSSNLSEAITHFHRVKTRNPKASLPDNIGAAVEKLLYFDGSDLTEIADKARKPQKAKTRKK